MGDVSIRKPKGKTHLEDDIVHLIQTIPVLEYEAKLAIIELCIKRLEFEREQILGAQENT